MRALLCFAACAAALVASRPSSAQQVAASTYASPPIRLSRVSSVRLSPEVFRFGRKLRIRNLGSGAVTVVDIRPEEPFLPAGALGTLVSGPDQEWLPEFSVLGGESAPEVLSATVLPPALRVRGEVLDAGSSRPRAIQPGERQWRVLGYRILRSSSGLAYLEVSDGVKTVFVTPEQAARRLELRQKSALAKLFDLGWRSLAIQRYDLGLEAFERIQNRGARLDEKERAQLNLGLALSRYHTEGCSRSLAAHLVEADRDPANQDDVSYYRALCALASEDYAVAEVLFRRLADIQHQNYGEASAFYLGVIAEADERYDDAESAYMDTIDFASDGELVAIARTRLENLKATRAFASLERKWISGGASVGVVYDTNVMALPAEISPANFGLSGQSASLSSNLFFLSLAPPWSRHFVHRLNYNFLFNKHFDPVISKSFDSNIHDVGTQLDIPVSPWLSHGFSYSWSRVALGPLSDSLESLKAHSASYALRLLHGSSPEKPNGLVEIAFKYGRFVPARPATDPARDLEGTSYTLSFKSRNLRHAGESYGPDLSFEERPSKGRENVLRDFRIGATWDSRFGEGSSPWSLGQHAFFSYKPYPKSALGRHDYMLGYVASLGRGWGANLDTRLQYQGNYNFSTVKSVYQYRQSSVSLIVTALF